MQVFDLFKKSMNMKEKYIKMNEKLGSWEAYNT